jgi:hypothetical protein
MAPNVVVRMTERPSDSAERWLAALIVLAFILRLGLRLSQGERQFFEAISDPYVGIARTFLRGGGLCVYQGQACALRMPGYPLLVASLMTIGRLYPGLVVLQSAFGALMVWTAWAIGRELFNARVGLIAATLTALNPYAVVHDTAMQETAILNSMLALGVLLLLRSRRSGTASIGAGFALAVGCLTTTRAILFLPAALIWSALAAGPSPAVRLRNTVLLALPLVLVLGGWTVRNWRIVGAPVLTTETGQSLWGANNALTFVYFPARSMDATISESFDHLTFDDQQALRRLDGQDVAQDRLLARWSREYAAAHPAAIALNAVRKVWVAVSGQLSPVRGRLTQLGYALFFVPIHLLAALGLWRSRQGSAPQTLIYMLFLAFAITTAIFWAHSSDKSYIDEFLFVYSASVLVASFDRLRPVDSQADLQVRTAV